MWIKSLCMEGFRGFSSSLFYVFWAICVTLQVNFVTREMLNWAVVMVKYLPFNWAERLTMIASRLWFGDMSKFGIPKPEEGPFTMKMKYGKYPLVDVGTCKKIRSGEIQVLVCFNYYH